MKDIPIYPPNEPPVTLDIALDHGLNEEEFQKICGYLKRIPTYTELGIYSVMWSEHCSYKNSILELKKLPRNGGRLLVSAGEENAGLVKVNDSVAIAFKIESHNHPSAVEPYQGAATGVGGILRDIFTMGAKPIANLVSLRFGRPDNSRNRYLIDGVTRGIADYGNCMGVPTVAGEVTFDDAYQTNPIVNAMTVGVVENKNIISATSKGVGNWVFYIGNKTGRDGIHGATFASDELGEDANLKRPNVQVGDPFTEKLLLEAVRELSQQGLLVGLQDMGAAGLSCSTSEMSARGKCGMVIDLDLVPTRETKMTPYEIMLSESQERMLAVCTPQNAEKLKNICEKWGVLCVKIGEVVDDTNLRIYYQKQLVANIPANSLVLGGGAPQYQRNALIPQEIIQKRNEPIFPDLFPSNTECFLTLIAEPNIASKRWIFSQFDHTVIANTVKKPLEADAAVIRIDGTNIGISVKTDCNPFFVELDPYWGTAIAVAEAALNVACTGAVPCAITNCLNFGNPYKPTSFYYFKESVKGMGDACRILETPVSGGNVSFYNESTDGSILPTPTIGMLGILDELDTVIGCDAKRNSKLFLIGAETKLDLGGSTLLRLIQKRNFGKIPTIDLELHKKLLTFLEMHIKNKQILSAHDCSDGGLAICIAEMAIAGNCGVQINHHFSDRLLWFSETPSRVVISIEEKNIPIVQKTSIELGLLSIELGNCVGDRIIIEDWLNISVKECAEIFEKSLINALGEN
ncbi:MAG: phosphoribosylformylglycinamidine synthase subunit PurL [bacterium]|nr:phosphoribosylformylglycinamidine synthase subunit PurL [bacterium]